MQDYGPIPVLKPPYSLCKLKTFPLNFELCALILPIETHFEITVKKN